jgi:hypothetical protein
MDGVAPRVVHRKAAAALGPGFAAAGFERRVASAAAVLAAAGGSGVRRRLGAADALMPRTFLTRQARWFPEGSLAELPDIDAGPGAFDIRRFALQAGDAIFFDFLAGHGAPGFPYPSRRRILSLRYLAADARHAPRPWPTSPPFDGLQAELPAGAAMDHPLFPVVWPP